MRAAATEPGPPMSAYRLDMSLSTPIFTTSPETWAPAPLAPSARATAAVICFHIGFNIDFSFSLNPEIFLNPVHVRLQPVVRDHVHDPAMLHHVVAVGHRLGE